MVRSAEETSRWTEPSWRDEAERWIREHLSDLGLHPVAAIEQPHVRPWGTALHVRTNGGTLWFKANIAPLAYEAPLLDLVGAGSASVPRLVAGDLTRGWMLMEDAGTKLSDVYRKGLPRAIWCELLGVYAQLQVDAAPAAGRLVAAGVPDRRLPTLVEGLRRVLGNDRLVRPGGDVALTDDELERAHEVLPAIENAVDVLAGLELPDSSSTTTCIHGTSAFATGRTASSTGGMRASRSRCSASRSRSHTSRRPTPTRHGTRTSSPGRDSGSVTTSSPLSARRGCSAT